MPGGAEALEEAVPAGTSKVEAMERILGCETSLPAGPEAAKGKHTDC